MVPMETHKRPPHTSHMDKKTSINAYLALSTAGILSLSFFGISEDDFAGFWSFLGGSGEGTLPSKNSTRVMEA